MLSIAGLFLVFLLIAQGVDSFGTFVNHRRRGCSFLPLNPTSRTSTVHNAVAVLNNRDYFSAEIFASSITIERTTETIPAKKSSGAGTAPAVVERPTETTRVDKEPVKQRRGQGNEAWEVRIYNDGLNTREHVARSLVQVTGMSEMNAYQTMMQAHQHGMAVVGRYVYEIAEMYHEALRKNGIVCDLVPVDDE